MLSECTKVRRVAATKGKAVPGPQERLFDPFEGVIGKAGRKQIESGWQSLFRDVLLKQLPVQRLGKDLSSDMGRPTA